MTTFPGEGSNLEKDFKQISRPKIKEKKKGKAPSFSAGGEMENNSPVVEEF